MDPEYAAQLPLSTPPPRRRAPGLRARGWLVLGALAAFVLVLAVISAIEVARFDVASLARHTPQRTALMRQRVAEAARDGRSYSIDVRTVPYERISPLLRRAVLIAEDDAFYSHDGLDWNEIKRSAKADWQKGRVVRGGSTITQQLAKNLFLGSEVSLTRKLREAFLAIRIEKALDKRRIFELYLNRIEWGNGIFGIEAAARRYFGVSASSLSPRQAVLLAAVIINPIRYSVLSPAPRIERRAKIIASRMRRRGYLSPNDYYAAIAQPPPATLAAAPGSTASDRSDLPPRLVPVLPTEPARDPLDTATDTTAVDSGGP